jgi:hypothetical protein
MEEPVRVSHVSNNLSDSVGYLRLWQQWELTRHARRKSPSFEVVHSW